MDDEEEEEEKRGSQTLPSVLDHTISTKKGAITLKQTKIPNLILIMFN